MTESILLPSTDEHTEEHLTPLYNLVLLDDDDHTFNYVGEMLCKLFLKSPVEAYRHAVEVDTTGRTVVLTSELEQAQFGRDQIHAYGADPLLARSTGPMRAIIEPAGGSRV